MANAWMEHVKAVKKQHPKKSLKEVLKMAGKSYKAKKSATVKKPKTGKKTMKKKGVMAKGGMKKSMKKKSMKKRK